MKILLLQNIGGFYGSTLAVLDDDRVSSVTKALKAREQAPGFVKMGDGGVTWQILDVDPKGVAVFRTGGSELESELLNAVMG